MIAGTNLSHWHSTSLNQFKPIILIWLNLSKLMWIKVLFINKLQLAVAGKFLWYKRNKTCHICFSSLILWFGWICALTSLNMLLYLHTSVLYLALSPLVQSISLQTDRIWWLTGSFIKWASFFSVIWRFNFTAWLKVGYVELWQFSWATWMEGFTETGWSKNRHICNTM